MKQMDRTEIKPGMMVVCKEAHKGCDIYWASPYMDEAIGKPMTVKQVDDDDTIFCQFDTDYPMDDGCWFFKADWLEPWEGEADGQN